MSALVQAYTSLSDIEGILDKQIYPAQLRDNFDAPDDCEYAVTITAGQWRQFCQAITMLERLCGEGAST
jgi:hypothetical protein